MTKFLPSPFPQKDEEEVPSILSRFPSKEEEVPSFPFPSEGGRGRGGGTFPSLPLRKGRRMLIPFPFLQGRGGRGSFPSLSIRRRRRGEVPSLPVPSGRTRERFPSCPFPSDGGGKRRRRLNPFVSFRKEDEDEAPSLPFPSGQGGGGEGGGSFLFPFHQEGRGGGSIPSPVPQEGG